MQGGIVKYVANVSSERACARYVKQEYPQAPGATWYDESSCWAEFGEHFAHSSVHRTCVFAQKGIPGPLQQISKFKHISHGFFCKTTGSYFLTCLQNSILLIMRKNGAVVLKSNNIPL